MKEPMNDGVAVDALPRHVEPRLLAPLCLAGAVLLWGTSFMATKTALAGFSPMVVVWLRMTIAACMVLFLFKRIPAPDYRKGDWMVLSFLCLMQPCLYFLLEGYAIALTTSAQAGMISALVPLLVMMGAWIILKESISLRGIIGIAVSMAGVLWLSLGSAPDATAPNPLLGNVLEIGAMVCAAVYMVVMKRLSTRYSTWWLTGMQCVAGALFFLPGAVLSGVGPLEEIPFSAWCAVGYLGFFVSLGAFGLYNMAMTFMPAGRAALAINMVSPVALASGWFLLGESMSPMQLAACGVIGAGVWVGRRG
ncbi:EamA family transporter [uncultured Pseudodesulfovibrio sp.]|uniref:DMT family transporter n=1 Tax=uncultured Pseudodesulfovibrio sp. TaxID=2035858 RepID=UPI0029C858BD|nr:EamA family transporter [uncultured Pseudodesulfovibrio sp.]